MALYRYQAMDGAGKKHSGLLEAMDEREAKQRLREQGLMVTSLALRTGRSSKESIRKDDLLNFTLQLSQLLNAGVPLYESLTTIEEQYRDASFHRVLLSLATQIKEGSSLSGAMGQFPDSFNKLYCAMVSAGEAVGSLSTVLQKLVVLLTKQQQMRSNIVTAMIYPGVLAGFCLIVIGVLMGFVVPSMEGMFEGMQLNTFTTLVLSASHFIRGYWWLYVPVIGLSIVGSIWWFRQPAGKLWWQRTILKIPYLRTLAKESATARFSRTLGTLLEGGLPLIDALRIARETMGNAVLENDVRHAEEKIIAGGTLSGELTRTGLFPVMATRMLAAGENAGTTVVMLNRIADIYENQLEQTLTRLVSLAQPVILIIMGGLIGTVMMAILLPMANMAQLTSTERPM